MRIRKHITKKMLLRLSFFMMIVAGAFVFDAFHKNDLKVDEDISSKHQSNDVGSDGIFFYASINNFSLKNQGQEISERFKFSSNLHKLLVFSQNQNTSRNAKYISAIRFVTINHSFHYTIFKRVYHRSPDDIPPIS